ncbi:Uncharacterised protein [Clostridioides difficile]|nr:Uncharacterised protein [Clostridioides difficile]SJU13615.1 Uncharacterised protein [Clostridioides difficile]SJU55396.1 Uncharacterised protein [Clostridioides difficile]SJU57753.1 Uncharacterised protein [Clostridioides difficile]SJU72125.1 Uncharacterised protein [Clostridioides difficile]
MVFSAVKSVVIVSFNTSSKYHSILLKLLSKSDAVNFAELELYELTKIVGLLFVLVNVTVLLVTNPPSSVLISITIEFWELNANGTICSSVNLSL